MGDENQPAGKPPEKKGGGFLKYCFGCCCLVIILAGFLGGYTVHLAKQSMSMDPLVIGPRVSAFLPATIPTGYSGQFYFKIPFQGTELAMIAPDGALQGGQKAQNMPLMIMLVNPPPGTKLDNMDDAKKQLNQSSGMAGNMGGAGAPQVEADPNAPATPNPMRTLKVRGEDVQVLDQVGASNQGAALRQVFVLVPKSKGSADKVIVVGMGDEKTFDQATFDAFIQSIR
jgi:hypothetical protein